MSLDSDLRSDSAVPEAPVSTNAGAISQYVLKIVSRCDLSCDHCYVYEHPDQGWRRQPITMAPSVVDAVADRIAAHAEGHGLQTVRVVLHGGEPLLAGAAGIAAVSRRLRSALGDRLDLRMQSNGVLLTPEICDVLVEHDVKIGISLDGDAAANDRHRRYANGASSHAQVLRALALLRRAEYRSSYAGILCTVDVANDPVQVYEALLAEQPPGIDFLLPHGNWDRPPPPGVGGTPYASWLLRIYRRWAADGYPVPIRFLDSLLSTAAGGRSHTEAVGLSPADLVVVETNGSFEQVDSLKSAFDGAPATGLTVFDNTVDEVAAHPMIAIRQAGLAGLCETCRACEYVRQCGGGLFAHRYGAGRGFDNPSVYCADLKELIRSMRPTAGPAIGSDDQLALAVLDDLAAGPGSAESITQLAQIHESMTRRELAVTGARTAKDPVAAAGWDLLLRLDEEAPDAVRVVLTHPFVRTWLAACRSAPDHLPYVACVAAAGAVRAGVTAELRVPARHGIVALPTLGAIRVEPGVSEVLLVAAEGKAGIRGSTPSSWMPAHRVHVDGRSMLLDDIDPYRDCYEVPVAARLDPEAADRWQRRLGGALRHVAEETPDYLAGIRTLLSTVVPLLPDPAGGLRSAAARSAFGAVAVAPVADTAALAELLVHEVQHLKLGMVLEVCDLFDPARRLELDVPWRPDPRPVEGAFQGTYAFLAVADVWRNRAGPAAEERFQLYRSWTTGALDTLHGSAALTALGRRFVARMRETLDGW